MPDPKKFKTRAAFMKVCVPMVIHEGTAKDGEQATAICSSMWERRDKKMIDNTMETKHFGGHVVETKKTQRNGVNVGVVAGHLAAWTPDIGGIYGMPDRFHRGAFLKSIDDHVARGSRPIRLRDMHGRTVGGFPIEFVKEDDIGLAVVGEINLEVQQGQEAYALARQDVLRDFSIGFRARNDKITAGYREIYEAEIVEGSIVDEPLNREAQITEVKSAVVKFQDLPLADRDYVWDPKVAEDRAKLLASEECKKAFLWAEDTEYKLLITDVVGGELKAVPRAIFDAAMKIKRGDIYLPDKDRVGVIRHIERYFAKMGLVSPFTDAENHFFGTDEVKIFDRRGLERALISTGSFSQKAAKVVASRYTEPMSAEILAELKTIKF